jgi:hypothetical protein
MRALNLHGIMKASGQVKGVELIERQVKGE